LSFKVKVQVTPPGSGLANSWTKVCWSTQRPSPPTGHSTLNGPAARGSPSGTIAALNRAVKRSIAPPPTPGVAISTCGLLSPIASVAPKGAATSANIPSRTASFMAANSPQRSAAS
jgi:hypothetical protein